nr:polysaccharide deacetylase family protein [uncultured Flavobacterium sp.]
MKKYIYISTLFCTLFLLFSCEKENPKPVTKPYKAGVILSFDDAYVNEWFATNQKLKKYGWKGTFFVCKINTLDQSEIEKLREMQKEGHEIAGHTYNHVNAVDYLRVNTIREYLNNEIDPMLHLMKFYGLNVSTFAYPYGGRSEKLDAALLKKFKIIRGRAFCEHVANKQGCYYDNSNLVFSFSIDDTHNHFNIPHLLGLLEYAKKNNKILILNSHKTVDTVTGDYQTKNATLEYICKYIKSNNMNFYTLSDIEKLQ